MPEKISNLPKNFLEGIGAVVVKWNHLELRLTLLLVRLLGKRKDDVTAMIPFAHMAFPHKMDVMLALAESFPKSPESGPSILEEAKQLGTLLKSAQEKRNIVVHSVWAMKDGEISSFKLSARKTLKISIDTPKIEEIEAALTAIHAATKSVYKFQELIEPLDWFAKAEALLKKVDALKSEDARIQGSSKTP